MVVVIETGYSQCLVTGRSTQVPCEQPDRTIETWWIGRPFHLANGEWEAID